MGGYMYLMHNDELPQATGGAGFSWDDYFEKLKALGCFRGGSAIGDGKCVRRQSDPPGIYDAIVGYIVVEAKNLADAEAMLAGNPVFEAGGTVEIRELPQTG